MQGPPPGPSAGERGKSILGLLPRAAASGLRFATARQAPALP